MEPVTNPAEFLQNVKDALQNMEELKKERQTLANEIKQQEKAVGAKQKQINEESGDRAKKKRAEMVGPYDTELLSSEESMKKTTENRSKAKADAVNQRIQAETAELTNANLQLEEQVKSVYKDGGVSKIFTQKFMIGLFYPKTLSDWIIDAVMILLCFFGVPLLIISATSNKLAMATSIFIYLLLVGGLYMFIFHKFMMKYKGAFDKAKEIQEVIAANTKKKNGIISDIKKDEDESRYNLESYDQSLSDLNAHIDEVTANRQKVLDEFQNTTQKQIEDQVNSEFSEELGSLQTQLNDSKSKAEEVDKKTEALRTELSENYEARLGKEYMSERKLDSLIEFCQENPTLNLEQILSTYKVAKSH